MGAAIAGCTGPEEGGDGMGAGGADDQDDGPVVVAVGPGGDTGFDPEEVEVDAERTVRWEWVSDGHTVTPQSVPEGASWSGEPDPQPEGHVYEHTFQVLGPYQYLCGAHPAETSGIVHVRERPNPLGDGFATGSDAAGPAPRSPRDR